MDKNSKAIDSAIATAKAEFPRLSHETQLLIAGMLIMLAAGKDTYTKDEVIELVGKTALMVEKTS